MDKPKEQKKEEMILMYDPGTNTTYDVKLSAAKKYISEAKKLELKLKKEGKL